MSDDGAVRALQGDAAGDAPRPAPPAALSAAGGNGGVLTRRGLLAMFVTALALAWPWLPEFSVTLLTYIGLYSLVALGLVMLTGVAGMTSFGQAAFVGTGAYATAWLGTSPWAAGLLSGAPALLPWAGLALGLALTAAVAWGLGAVTLRLSGHYLPLATIAWGLSLYFLFGSVDLLGGHTGISGVPPIVVGGLSLASPRALGIVVWALLLAVLWALHNLLDSREGRALRALKGGRVMAESMGVDTARQRARVFVLAALLAALSGWLYAHLQRFVNPSPFNLNVGIEYLFMAVVGGAGHLWGAVLGATLITLLKEQLQDWLPRLLGTSGNFEVVVFGLMMIVVLQRFADGIWPALARVGGRRLLHPEPPRPPSRAAQPLPAREPAPAGSLLLEARQVTRRFGGLVANDRITLDLRAGEIHALIGPNGAGKSTFFDMISGTGEPTSGEVRLIGRLMAGRPSRAFAALGLARTFQHVRLLGARSVLDNVALGAHLRGRRGWVSAMLRLDRAEEAALLAEASRQIERCGLAADAALPAASLPLGRQRIVEIARALAGAPLVLLLDEPAAGLRHLEKAALAALLAQLRAEGLGLLVVEHDMEFVMNLADRVTVLEFGRVIASGTPAEVQADRRVLEAYLGVGEDDDDERVAAARLAAPASGSTDTGS